MTLLSQCVPGVEISNDRKSKISRHLAKMTLAIAAICNIENSLAADIPFYITNASATGTSKVGKLDGIIS